MSDYEATEEIEAAFDRELSKISDEHRCVDGRVSIVALCELLGYSSVWSATRLQESYRNAAKQLDLSPYTLKKRFANNPSSKAKMAWILVKDAVQFLLSRGRKNNNVVTLLLNNIVQKTTATNTNYIEKVHLQEQINSTKEYATHLAVELKAAKEKVVEEAQKSDNHKRNFDRLLEVTTKAQNFDEVFAEPESGEEPDNDGVYVLELGEGGKFYVGQSRNISRRIEDHQSGRQRAAYVDANGGILRQLAPSTPRNEDFAEWEKKETLYLMMKYGYENVRGWEWTRVGPLCFNDLHMIKRDLMGTLNLCRKCGTKGHFAAQCNIRPENRNGWLKELDKLISKANSRGAGRLSFEQLMDDLI